MPEMHESTGTRAQRQVAARSLVYKFVRGNSAVRNVSKQALHRHVANAINYSESFVFGPKLKLDNVDVRNALTKLHADGVIRCGVFDNSPLYDDKHYAVVALK